MKMIILFHIFYMVATHVIASICTTFVKRHPINNAEESGPIDRPFNKEKTDLEEDERTRESDVGLRFFPPVYVQRYMIIQDVLLDKRWEGTLKKVVDFGCAEFGFFPYVKHIPGIEEILTVDIDEELLNRFTSRVAPLTTDYLSNRENPLTVKVLAGSIVKPDSCLKGTDAVICIEIIEHLWPEEVNAVPYAVFGVIQPQLAIFTTPNSDFNVLFPNFTGFRHWDHKFEWSREQFECWATNITLRYPAYAVSFHGIGAGPSGTETYGHCSQMALFVKNASLVAEPALGDMTEEDNFNLVTEYVYPFRVDNRTETEKICHEAEYQIRLYGTNDDFCNDGGLIEIPICLLLPSVEKWLPSLDTLRKILESNGWEMSDKNPEVPTVIYPYFREHDRFDEENEDILVDSLTSLPNSAIDMNYTDSNEDWDWDILMQSSTLHQANDGLWKVNDLEISNPVDNLMNRKLGCTAEEANMSSEQIITVEILSPSLNLESVSKLMSENGLLSVDNSDEVEHSNSKNTLTTEESSLIKTVALEAQPNEVCIMYQYQKSDSRPNLSQDQNYSQTTGSRQERKRGAIDDCFSNLDKISLSLSSDSRSQSASPVYKLCPGVSNLMQKGSASTSMETDVPLVTSSELTSDISLIVNVSDSLARLIDVDVDSSSDEVCVYSNSHLELGTDVVASTEHSNSEDSLSDQSQEGYAVVDHHAVPPRIQAHRNHFPFNINDAPVENGDLANNNRDGEGNNAIALIPEGEIFDVLAFEMDEGDHEEEFVEFEEDDDDDDDVGDHDDDVDFIELDIDDEPLLPGYDEPFPNWLLNLLQVVDNTGGPEMGGAGEPNRSYPHQ